MACSQKFVICSNLYMINTCLPLWVNYNFYWIYYVVLDSMFSKVHIVFHFLYV